MVLPALTSAIVLSAAAAAAAPGMPSGQPAAPAVLMQMYDKAPRAAAWGEPWVSVGLATGQQGASLRAHGAMTLRFTHLGRSHALPSSPGATLTVRVLEGTPAPTRWLVPLAPAVAFTEAAALDAAKQAPSFWPRALGPLRPEPVEQVQGVAWPHLDLRDVRPAWVQPTYARARALRQALVRADVLPDHAPPPEPQRQGYPAGRLLWTVTPASGKAISGEAEGGVEWAGAANAMTTVHQVPFGMGYAWAGAEDRRYRGELWVGFGGDGALAIVNTVPIEALLLGLVPAEMPARAPAAALEAQAIAARSNIVWGMGRRHTDMPFHFCAEQHCQVYAGQSAEDLRTSQAVAQTHGAVLMHGGRVVNALYSASCGGYTEDNDVAWPLAPDSALRGVDDGVPSQTRVAQDADGRLLPLRPHDAPPTAALDRSSSARLHAGLAGSSQAYCAQSTLAGRGHGRWQRQLDRSALVALAAAQGPPLGALRDIVPGPRGPGGRLKSITLVGTKRQRRIDYELPIRQALGGLHSAAVLLTPEHDVHGELERLTITGVGWGHGVGMCQMGAIGRSEAGASHAEILAHYYGGARTQILWGPKALHCIAGEP